MRTFNLRALNTAVRKLRSGASATSYANGVVQETLARHGLVAEPGALMPGGNPDPISPNDLGSFRTFQQTKPAPTVAIPDGATFTDDLFSCNEGARRYLTYVPASAADGLQGLIVMLHGCTQTPEDFAQGTRMNDWAEARRLVVVYPHQSRGENAQSCWNWFRRGDQRRDRGEPAILSGLARSAAAGHGIPDGAIFAAGLSAGGAMAAILGETYPEVFSAVAVHSGLPVESAKDVASAFAAMSGNPTPRVSKAPGRVARTIVLHGTADSTVHPGNGQEIIRQVLHHGPQVTLQADDRGQIGGRTYSRSVTTDPSGAMLAEHWEIEGLGHGWSGGSRTGTYTDPKGPDASAEIVRFFLD